MIVFREGNKGFLINLNVSNHKLLLT